MAFDYSIVQQALYSFDFGLGGSLIGIIIILVSAIVITRDTRNLRLLLFPLAVGYYQIGLINTSAGYVILAFTALVWGVTLVGSHIIGSTLSGVGEAMIGTTRSIVRAPFVAVGKGYRNAQEVRRGTPEYRAKVLNQEIKFKRDISKLTKKERTLTAINNKYNKPNIGEIKRPNIPTLKEISDGLDGKGKLIMETPKLTKAQINKLFKENPILKQEMSKLRRYMMSQGRSGQEAYDYVGRQLRYKK